MVECLIASVIIGLIRGGRLSRFSFVDFKRVWIFILALAVQTIIIVLGVGNNQFVLKYTKELYILSYSLLFVGIIVNIRFRALWIIMIGSLMNFSAFLANGYKIPVSMDGLKLAGFTELYTFMEEGKLILYTPITEATKYSVLGEIITIPAPYPYPQILSVGDLVIALGLFVFIQSIMLDEGLDRSKMVRFKYKSRI